MSTTNFSISPGPQVPVGDYGDSFYSPPPPSTNKEQIIIAVSVILAGMIAIVLIGYTVCTKTKKNFTVKDSQTGKVREPNAATTERFLHDMAKEMITRFTAQELQNFTNNYSIRLGSGGFGTVYQGQFRMGVKIAVKVLNTNPNRKKVEEQFRGEVGSIGRTYHINLVRLYGYCFDQQTSALVYEYMENNSLDKLLFSNETPQKIELEKLQEIAVGTAKGLAYLHEECHQRIIHYDIKPGNILLDLNLSPKVADFGLAKLCNRDNTHVSLSGYRGTPGYSAPEFLTYNYPITHKCDVYSFGMLLFEIARRRRNTSTTDSSDSVDWFPKKAWEEYEKGGLKDLITAEVKETKESDKEKVERMLMVALWCVQDSPNSRPLMSSVVKMLEGGVEILSPPNPFRYLYEHTGYVTGGAIGTNNYSTTTRTNSSQNENKTSLVREHEIHIASS